MQELTIFTIIFILIQTLVYVLWGWLTLECKFRPYHEELQEITLAKLLYLYDPQACGRLFFYNYTVWPSKNQPLSKVQWPVKNEIASRYRETVRANMSLHILWLLFGIAYMTQSHRSCAFYATLLPFTMIGVSLLCMDLFTTTVFLIESGHTKNETAIWNYINGEKKENVYEIEKDAPMVGLPILIAITDSLNNTNNKVHSVPKTYREDTSWISLLFAYMSCRGVVIWVFNLWIVKDNYTQGFHNFRRFRTSVKEKDILDI